MVTNLESNQGNVDYLAKNKRLLPKASKVKIEQRKSFEGARKDTHERFYLVFWFLYFELILCLLKTPRGLPF